MQADLPEYVTVREAAEALHVTERRVQLLIQEGVLEAIRAGARLWLIKRESLQAELYRRLTAGRRGPKPKNE